MKRMLFSILDVFRNWNIQSSIPPKTGTGEAICTEENRQLVAISKLNFRLIDIDTVFAN